MFKENKDFKWSVIKDNFLSQDECDKLKYHIKNTRENLGEIPEGIKWNELNLGCNKFFSSSQP